MLHASPEIDIKGLNSEQEDNVRAYLPLTKETCEAPQWKIKRLFKESSLYAERALRALGYYQPEIQKNLDWSEDCWQVSFDITIGAPMLIDVLDIQVLGEGGGEDFFVELLQKKSIKRGDIVHHGQYEKLKKDLQTLAEAKGYFDYEFVRKQLSIDRKTNKAEIHLHLQTGQRYYISRIDIEKNKLDTDFTGKFLTVNAGQPYDRNMIVGSHQLLDASGYFKNIQLKYVQEEAEDYYAPLLVKLDNLPRHKMSAGVGYDTDLGVRLSGAYNNRYVTESGHRFNSDLNLSLKKSNLLLEYAIPLSKPLKEHWSFFAGMTYEDTSSIKSQRMELGTKLSNQLYGQLMLSEQLKFVAERFRHTRDDPFDIRYLLVPGVSISNVRAIKEQRYLKGYKYFLQIDGAHRSVVSDVSFIQARLNMKFAYPTFLGGRILARLDLGATAVDVFEDLPTSYRFYAGGDNSVRGYDYKSIGQRDASGEVIGGRYLTTAGFEYEQQIVGDWSMAVFVDAGDAFSSHFNMKFGAGLGVRWYSMVGPVRVDIAVPTQHPGDVHFHFSLSTAL